MAKKIIYISIFLAAAIILSCSELDQTGGLGRKIVENKSQDGMKPGVYKTVTLEKNKYASITDASSGKRNYPRFSQWAIGNWGNEETILKLHHKGKGENRISRLLDSLIGRSVMIAEPASIKAELLWNNETRNNSLNNANIEIGVIFYNPQNSTDTAFFPLNFALVNPQNAVSSVPFTIETYLLEEKEDTAYIERYEAKYTNFVDTVTIVSPYTSIAGNWELKEKDIKVVVRPEKNTGGIKFATDTLVSWKHYVDSSLYYRIDTLKDTKTVMGYDTVQIEEFKLFRKNDKNVDVEFGTIKHRREITPYNYNNKFPTDDDIFSPSNPDSVSERIVDTLIITYKGTFRDYRISKKGVKDDRGDSTHTTIKFTSASVNAKDFDGNLEALSSGSTSASVKNAEDFGYKGDKESDKWKWVNDILNSLSLRYEAKPDTLIQTGYKYKTALAEPKKHEAIRGVVGGDNGSLGDLAKSKVLKHELVMYLRVNKESRENIIHISPPVIRLSYVKYGDISSEPVRYYINIPFTDTSTNNTEISVIAKSSDELSESTPVISGALQRFAEIDLNLGEFFYEIENEKFLSIGLAELTLNIEKVDFPTQYGDSILLNAIISDKKLTPEDIFALPNTRRLGRAYVKRNSKTVKINLALTLTDLLYQDKYRHIYEDTQPQEEEQLPEKTYLYLWLDDLRMGRTYFEPREKLSFTYILQTRKSKIEPKPETDKDGE